MRVAMTGRARRKPAWGIKFSLSLISFSLGGAVGSIRFEPGRMLALAAKMPSLGSFYLLLFVWPDCFLMLLFNYKELYL
jgi:hypothetical protein